MCSSRWWNNHYQQLRPEAKHREWQLNWRTNNEGEKKNKKICFLLLGSKYWKNSFFERGALWARHLKMCVRRPHQANELFSSISLIEELVGTKIPSLSKYFLLLRETLGMLILHTYSSILHNTTVFRTHTRLNVHGVALHHHYIIITSSLFCFYHPLPTCMDMVDIECMTSCKTVPMLTNVPNTPLDQPLTSYHPPHHHHQWFLISTYLYSSSHHVAIRVDVKRIVSTGAKIRITLACLAEMALPKAILLVFAVSDVGLVAELMKPWPWDGRM